MWQVVGVSKLRTKYESHEAKRILAGAYDLFVADERVIPSLPKLLGASYSTSRVYSLSLRRSDHAAAWRWLQ